MRDAVEHNISNSIAQSHFQHAEPPRPLCFVQARWLVATCRCPRSTVSPSRPSTCVGATSSADVSRAVFAVPSPTPPLPPLHRQAAVGTVVSIALVAMAPLWARWYHLPASATALFYALNPYLFCLCMGIVIGCGSLRAILNGACIATAAAALVSILFSLCLHLQAAPLIVDHQTFCPVVELLSLLPPIREHLLPCSCEKTAAS